MSDRDEENKEQDEGQKNQKSRPGQNTEDHR